MKTQETFINEELKDEIYRIIEIAITDKMEQYEKRIRDLEILKAEIVEIQNELKHEIEKLKSEITNEKSSSSNALLEINKELSKISGELKAISEKLKKKK